MLPGNHESADQIAGFCARFGFHDFHGQHAADRPAITSPASATPAPRRSTRPGEYSEDAAGRAAGSASPNLKPLVLICHAPPYGTALDRVRDGLHAGSRSVRDFIDRHQPEYFFCGHIHEAEGAEINIGKTKAVNVGKRGYLLELN